MWQLVLALAFGLLVGCSGDEVVDEPGNPELPASPEDGVEPGDHLFVLPVSDTDATWYDMAFLAAVPTSAKLNGQIPLVLASPTPSAMAEPTRDFIKRLSPQNLYVLGSDRPGNIEGVGQIHGMDTSNVNDYSVALIEEHWTNSEYLVVTDAEDYVGALMAASLASRLGAPMIFGGVAADTRDSLISDLGVDSIVWVNSNGQSSPITGENVTVLSNVEAVLSWAKDQELGIDYLALTNANDRYAGKNQKLSLTAPIYASRRNGLVVPVSLEIPAQTMTAESEYPVLELLDDCYSALGRHPNYLALVGSFDALPQMRQSSIFDNPISEHPVSDLPYAEVDTDAFSDIAIGRIVSDTVEEGTALAGRVASLELLRDGVWNQRFIETGLWGFDELRSLMRNVGFEPPEHPDETMIRAADRYEVAAILHKDHSNCLVLGNAFDTNVQALYAPAVVTSRGCSVGGMDLVGSEQRTIVEHMLGKGAVAFLGATRNSIAENTLIEVAFWNHLLQGATLGEAFRAGINEMMVHWIDEGENSGIRYSLDIEILYGDPAMSFGVPAEPIVKPASAELVENTVTVQAPSDWSLVQFVPEQLQEWNYQDDLFMYVGPGVSPRTYWSGSHDSVDPYYGVNIHLPSPVNQVEQRSVVADPLGWSGRFHTDTHQDGTYTIRWRVRLLDYDMVTGEILSQAAEVTYTLDR